MDFAERALDLLARASLQGAVLIAMVWAVCRLLPRLPASLRCTLWWLACLQLLVGLVWTDPVALPLLPAREVVTVAPAEPSVSLPVETVSVQTAPAAPAAPARSAGFPWAWAALGVWLTGLGIHLALSLAQLRETRRVVRGAEPVAVPWMRQAFAEMVRLLGLRRSPDLRSSTDIATPQALGLLRPLVLLPRDAMERLSPGEVTMTLCHEALHVRRGDLWLGWVPALAERLFFFHPLAALAAREYALAREAACDAEVLRVLGAEPQDYGRLLVRLGVSPRHTGLAAAGASPSFLNLKRRLQMLQNSSERSRRTGAWWIIPVVLLAGVVPYRIVAAEAEAPKAGPATRPAVAPKAVPAVAARSAAAPKAAPKAVPAVAAVPAPKAVPAAQRGNRTGPPPAPPAPPVPPVPPAPPIPEDGHGKGHSYVYRNGDGGDDYVLRLGDNMTMNGSTSDREMKEAMEQDGDMLWFRQGGKAYVIRDAAFLRRAGDLFERQKELGQKQAELGRKQAELGRKQAELGRQQAALGREQGSLARQQARRDYDPEETEQKRRELGEKQGALGEQQGELGARQGELGEKQGELGRQQAEEGEKAERALRAMMAEAVRNGIAQEVRK